jgi:hypothetical protein
MPCSLIEVHRRFGGKYGIFHPEGGGSTFLRNVGELVPGYTASHYRRHNSSWTPRKEPQMRRLEMLTTLNCLEYCGDECVLLSVNNVSRIVIIVNLQFSILNILTLFICRWEIES